MLGLGSQDACWTEPGSSLVSRGCLAHCIFLCPSSSWHRNELFVSSSGARPNALKILVVITDGEKYGDDLEYDDVIPRAEKKGIIRYVIGVGDVAVGLVFLCGFGALLSLQTALRIKVESGLAVRHVCQY